jgi:hypothetical protein
LNQADYTWKVSPNIFNAALIEQFFGASQINVSAYLHAFENALPSKMRMLYLVCYHANEIVAIAFFQQFKFSATHVDDVGKCKNLLIRLGLKTINCRLSFCGSLFCIALPGLGFKQGMSVLQKADAIKNLVKQHGTSVTVLKDVQNNDLFNSFTHTKKCFTSTVDSTMEMPINASWISLDDYLNALHHKYRQRAKKVIKSFETVTQQNFDYHDLLKYETEIYLLYNSVVAKQKFRIGKVEANYFQALKQSLKEQFIVTGYFLGNTLIAFRSAFAMNNRIEIHFIGFDYAHNKSHQVYFNILYDNIALAITKKSTIMELGRTAQDAKSTIGAKPNYFNDLIFFKSNLFKRLFNFLFNRYYQGYDLLPNRNPFKD